MVSELITAVLNTNIHVFKVSPVFAIMELETISRLCNLFNIPNGDGITCPGGSFSNLLALITARNLAFPNIKSEGFYQSSKKLIVFTSDQAHYSIAKACMVTGIGTNNLIKIATDNRGRMDVTEFENQIKKVMENNNIPLFVNATAGTTVKGSFDNFYEIGSICRKYNIWFHIDACWGGSVIFSSTHSHLMRGSEFADSIAWNAHKMLGVPIQTSFLLMKNPKALHISNSLEDISYLFHNDNDDTLSRYDVGSKTIMCGRRPDVTKFYLSWQFYGSSTFATWVDQAFQNAKYFYEKLLENNNFELVFPLESFNVCFRYSPDSLSRNNISLLSSFNRKISDVLQERRKVFIDFSSTKEEGMFFRLIFHTTRTQTHHIDYILSEIVSIGDENLHSFRDN